MCRIMRHLPLLWRFYDQWMWLWEVSGAAAGCCSPGWWSNHLSEERSRSAVTAALQTISDHSVTPEIAAEERRIVKKSKSDRLMLILDTKWPLTIGGGKCRKRKNVFCLGLGERELISLASSGYLSPISGLDQWIMRLELQPLIGRLSVLGLLVWVCRESSER